MVLNISGTYDLNFDSSFLTFQNKDIYFICDTSIAPVNIILFDISKVAGRWNSKIHIIDISNNAALNNISVYCPITNKINTSGLFVINKNGASAFLQIVSNNIWQCFSTQQITSAYQYIQDEGNTLPQQNTIDFQGAGVTATNGIGKTIVTIPSSVNSRTYGSFYDTTNQSPTSNTTVAMQYNSTDLTCTNGISIVNNLSGKPTRITPTVSGVYNIQFSAQIDRLSGGGGSSADANIWLSVSGTPVTWSNTRMRFQANDRYNVASWNWFIYLTVGQYLEIEWSQTDALFLLAEIAGVHPAIPSVILTVTQIF